MRRPANIEYSRPGLDDIEIQRGWVIGFSTDNKGSCESIVEWPNGRVTREALSSIQFTDWERDT